MENEIKKLKEEIKQVGEHSAQWELIKWQGQQFASTIKKLWILIIVLITLLFVSNMAWLAYINQYDFSSETVAVEAEQDGNGTNIVGGGDVDYGAESENYQNGEETN